MPLCRKTSAVALGSNLGDSLELLSTAANALQQLAAAGSFRCSPLFRTAPVGGPADQPDFINAVVLLNCSLVLRFFVQVALRAVRRLGWGCFRSWLAQVRWDG